MGEEALNNSRLYNLYCKGRQIVAPDILSELQNLSSYEDCLLRLDEVAFEDLRKKATQYDFTFHPIRGFSFFIDLLNEARGYMHLLEMNCKGIKFIPEGNGKSPDLEATCHERKIYLEVKTIHKSDIDSGKVYFNTYGNDPQAADVQSKLSDSLRKKLTDSLNKAENQLWSVDNENSNAIRISLFFGSLDSTSIPNAVFLKQEIEKFLRENATKSNVEIIWD